MSDNPDLRDTKPGHTDFHSTDGEATAENVIRIDRSTATSNGTLAGGRQNQPAIVSFNRSELDQILRIYGFKVADGEWKDYSIDMLKDRAVFSVYRRAHDMPLHCIEKVPNRFDLVLLAAHRSRMIREGSPITVDRDNDKDPVVSLREIADESVDLKVVKEALISGLQDIRPGEEMEREADRVALLAAPAATEDDVMRAYQAELESGRDDRL